MTGALTTPRRRRVTGWRLWRNRLIVLTPVVAVVAVIIAVSSSSNGSPRGATTASARQGLEGTSYACATTSSYCVNPSEVTVSGSSLNVQTNWGPPYAPYKQLCLNLENALGLPGLTGLSSVFVYGQGGEVLAQSMPNGQCE